MYPKDLNQEIWLCETYISDIMQPYFHSYSEFLDQCVSVNSLFDGQDKHMYSKDCMCECMCKAVI